MDQVWALALINEKKFGLTSKNTIVAVKGDTSASKRFHHLSCSLLYPGREKGFDSFAEDGEVRKPRNYCYVAGTFLCRIEVPRRFNYAVCGKCYGLFTGAQVLEWAMRLPMTNDHYNVWSQACAEL